MKLHQNLNATSIFSLIEQLNISIILPCLKSLKLGELKSSLSYKIILRFEGFFIIYGEFDKWVLILMIMQDKLLVLIVEIWTNTTILDNLRLPRMLTSNSDLAIRIHRTEELGVSFELCFSKLYVQVACDHLIN